MESLLMTSIIQTGKHAYQICILIYIVSMNFDYLLSLYCLYVTSILSL